MQRAAEKILACVYVCVCERGMVFKAAERTRAGRMEDEGDLPASVSLCDLKVPGGASTRRIDPS